MTTERSVQDIFNLMINSGRYGKRTTQSPFMCVAITQAARANEITSEEYLKTREAIKKFLLALRPSIITCRELPSLADVLGIHRQEIGPPYSWFHVTLQIYSNWDNRFSYMNYVANGHKPKKRTLQEIFNAVIDSGLYGGAPAKSMKATKFMCIALVRAANEEVISFEECRRANTSIKTYLNQSFTLADYLNLGEDSSEWISTTTQIYRNWSKRPRLSRKGVIPDEL